MNYTSFIVKILKKPKQSFLKNNIIVTNIIVRYVSPRIKTFNIKNNFQISIWEKFSYDTVKYYKPNDYIIVEGYISLRTPFITSNKTANTDRQVEISVFKHYPLVLR